MSVIDRYKGLYPDKTGQEGKQLMATEQGYTFSPVGRKNLIINGNFDIWQRGDNLTGNGYFADRWTVIWGVTSAQENTTGTPSGFRRNALVTRNVAGTATIAQRIDAFDSSNYVGENVTLQFYHALETGNITSIDVELRYADAENDFTTTTLIETINVSDITNGFKEVTFAALPQQAVNGVELRFSYTCSVASSFRLTAVQLERGSVATGYENRWYVEEFELCQRYYEVGEATFYSGTALSGPYLFVPFKTNKRATPTVIRTGNGSISDATSGSAVISVGSKGFYFYRTGASNAVGGNYTANAEL